jgi:polyisoprenoid-binding protein YceI
MRKLFFHPILAVAILCAPVRAQSPGSYKIDPQASRIEIRVFRTGLLSALGDNHSILLTRFTGKAEASAGKPWEVRVLGRADSLEVTDPGASPSTRQQVQHTMLGPTQLDVTRYPMVELRSRSVLPGSMEKSWRIIADLTLHGVTRQAEFPLVCEQSGSRLRVSGQQKLKLRDFNIEPIRVAGGTIKVRNEFEIVYDITLKRQ